MNETDFLFVLGWSVLPVFWGILLRYAGLELLRPTIPSTLVAFLIVFQYLGLPILYFGLDDYRALYVTEKTIVLEVWALTSLSMTLVLVGCLIARAFTGTIFIGSSNPFAVPNLTRYQYGVLIGFGLLSIWILYLYLDAVGFSNIALLAALHPGGQMDVGLARSLMGNDFPGKYHWYRVFFYDVLMLIFSVFFTQFMRSGKTSYLMPLLFFGFFLIFALTAAAEKGPFVNFIILVLLLYAATRFEGRLPARTLFIGLFAVMGSLSVLYRMFMAVEDWGDVLISIGSRILTGQIQPAYHYVDYIPKHRDWLYGSSFPNPVGIFPFEPVRLTVEVMNFALPEQLATGVVGSMPTVFWGEMYANFSYAGVIASSILIGFSLYLLNKILFSLKPNPFLVPLYVYLIVHYKDLSGTSLSGFLLDLPLLMVLFVFILARPRGLW